MKTIRVQSFVRCHRNHVAEIMTMIANTCVGTSAPVLLQYVKHRAEITVHDADYDAVEAKVALLDFTPFMVEDYPRSIVYDLDNTWFGKLWTKLFGKVLH